MKFGLSILLSLVVALNLMGQDFELAGIRYLNYPKSEPNGRDGYQFSIQEYGGFFNIPTVLNKDSSSVMLNGFNFAQIKINLSGDNAAIPADNITVNSISYRFSFIHKFNNKWSFAGMIEPTLASDFKSKLSSDDLVIQSMGMVSAKINSKFLIGGGLAYTSRFGQPRIVPVVPIKYKSKKHLLSGVLPTKIIYTYQINPKIDIGFKAIVNGANFNITGYSNEFSEINKINYTRTNIGPVLYYKPKKIFSIEVSGGISTNRTFKLVDINNNSYNNSSSTEAFFNIGLVIKPFKNK